MIACYNVATESPIQSGYLGKLAENPRPFRSSCTEHSVKRDSVKTYHHILFSVISFLNIS
jgi:hypothetical protein